MPKIKKIIPIILINILFMSQCTYSMFQRLKTMHGRFAANRPLLKEVAEHTAIFGSAIALGEFFSRKNSIPAPSEVNQFAQNEFQKIGIKKQVPVRVLPKNSTNGTRTIGNTVYLEYEDCNTIMQLLSSDQHSPKLHAIKGMLQHEGVHVRDKHAFKTVASLQASTLFALRVIPLSVNKWGYFKKIPLSIVSLPFQACSIFLPTYLLGLHHERQADRGIIDDADVLKARSAEFRELSEQPRFTMRELFEKSYYKEIFSRITDTHDDDKTRAENFEKRLRELEHIKK